MVGGAFCLMRLLPLLDVLGSPVRQPVEAVVDGCLGAGGIADDVLIALDDFCQAVGPLQDFDLPASFEQGIAAVALLAAGAGRPYPAPVDERIAERAVGEWNALARLLADRSPPSASAVPADLVERERRARREDVRVLTASEHDPTAVLRRADRLAAERAAMRAELSVVPALFGGCPSGACGRDCTWPVCGSSAANCVRSRAFRPQQTLAARLRREHGAEAEPWYLVTLDLEAADDEPFEYLAEIGTDGHELRKVAQYMDGSLVRVDRAHPVSGGVHLAPDRLPPWPELEADPDRHVEETSAEFFERRWEEGLTGFVGRGAPAPEAAPGARPSW